MIGVSSLELFLDATVQLELCMLLRAEKPSVLVLSIKECASVGAFFYYYIVSDLRGKKRV